MSLTRILESLDEQAYDPEGVTSRLRDPVIRSALARELVRAAFHEGVRCGVDAVEREVGGGMSLDQAVLAVHRRHP